MANYLQKRLAYITQWKLGGMVWPANALLGRIDQFSVRTPLPGTASEPGALGAHSGTSRPVPTANIIRTFRATPHTGAPTSNVSRVTAQTAHSSDLIRTSGRGGGSCISLPVSSLRADSGAPFPTA